MFWDHVGSSFSDLGQKGVPFFLRTIQHCHLLTLTDEPAGPPSTLAHIHVCHVQEKVPTHPSNTAPWWLPGLHGACASRGAGTGWRSDITLAPSFTSWLRHSRSCRCLATCLRAHGSSVYKHDPRTLPGSYERGSECHIPRARLT